MSTTIKLVSLSAAAMLGLGLLSGCTDQQARDMAQDAMMKAEAAQACCDRNAEKIDRMYQRVMSK
jgi:hypothetical protein